MTAAEPFIELRGVSKSFANAQHRRHVLHAAYDHGLNLEE